MITPTANPFSEAPTTSTVASGASGDDTGIPLSKLWQLAGFRAASRIQHSTQLYKQRVKAMIFKTIPASFDMDATVTQLISEKAVRYFVYDDASGEPMQVGSVV
jgi:hypothetical protein